MNSVIHVTSTKQMRVLAHPLRLRVLGELRIGGPHTVGGLSDLVGEAPGTLSYHLGKLAEFGFVEEAPELATDRREHWWRAAHEFTDMPDLDPDAPADVREAGAAAHHQVVDMYAATLHRVVDQPAPMEWTAAGIHSDTIAFLTPDELSAASAELRAVLDKWHAHSGPDRPGTAAVQLMAHAFRRPS